jgi:hypothetical protein
MVTVLFTPESGVDANNVPSELLAISSSFQITNIGMIIGFANHSVENIVSILRSYNYVFDADRRSLIITVSSVAERAVPCEEVITQVQCDGPAEHIVTEVVTCAVNTTNREGAEEVEEEREEEHEEEREVDGEVDGGFDNIVMTEIPTTGATRNEILKVLPLIVAPEKGQMVALLSEKTNQFNRMWSNIISLKRRIDELAKIVGDDEMLKKIEEDIEFISSKCPDIESVGMCADKAGYISIKTKEIITSELPVFGRRKVGRLQIIIDIVQVYSSVEFASNNELIQIRNLDRVPSGFVCGHVHATGDGSSSISCFGTYFDHIFDAVVSKNLALLLDVILRFVKNPDINDQWGVKISLFPAVTNEA